MKINVKMIGPVTQTTDLQIICVFKHNPAGDKYIEAMRDFDDKLGHLLSSERDRGEFVGELGETFLFVPPAARSRRGRCCSSGLGEEGTLSLDTVKVAGRVALREAVRLKAVHVSFAPTIRDQGNQVIDVGAGDRAVAENVISAYDTEKRLQAQSLAELFSIADWTIEAGSAFFATRRIKLARGLRRRLLRWMHARRRRMRKPWSRSSHAKAVDFALRRGFYLTGKTDDGAAFGPSLSK